MFYFRFVYVFLMALAILPAVVVAQSAGYGTVKIGRQVWMDRNLAVTTFRNGDPIPEAQSREAWMAASQAGEPAWCYYLGDPKNGDTYGLLYNWHAVNDPRGLAPAGWRVASEQDWEALIDALGGKDVAPGKIKSKKGWKYGKNGKNTSAFNGMPAGYRYEEGGFNFLKSAAHWWTATPSDKYPGERAHKIAIRALSDRISLAIEFDGVGHSVRCVKE